MKQIYILFFSIVFSTLTTFAQTFEIGGQLRPRAEYRHGYKSLIGDEVDPAFAISQRTRININYSSSLFKTVFSLQDVRVWGDVVTANKSDLNGTMIHQAWGELFFKPNISLKAGRQVISYDDQRLFGGLDWVQQARSHDALLVKYSPSKKLSVHLGFAYNQSSEKDTGNYYSLNNYKALQYLWSHYEGKKFGVSFFFINNGMPHNTTENEVPVQMTRYSQTFGPYITYSSGKFKANLSGYLQTGKNAKNIAKSAYFAGFDLSYALTKQFGIGAGTQYLSGNSQIEKGDEDHEFATLYSTGHKFNGWMDYFYAGSSHKGVGLIDLYLPLTYKKNKFSTEFQLHYYLSAADVKDVENPSTAMDTGFGTEAGIMLTYAILPEVSLSGGYSQMFGTETLQAVKGGNYKNTQNWTWIMLTFNPTFFKSEK